MTSENECNHVTRLRLGRKRKVEYLCLLCDERWTASYDGKVPQAPEGWDKMELPELRVWFARNILKAVI